MMMDWYEQAEMLEKDDRMEEAEQVIGEAVRDQAFAREIAEMYRKRMIRLRAAGDEAGAMAARVKSSNWACFYASQATSGGEGTAMSRERDAFLARL